jgi:hypothetical protein
MEGKYFQKLFLRGKIGAQMLARHKFSLAKFLKSLFSNIHHDNKMPAISAGLQNLDLDGGVEVTRFPAATKQAVGQVNGTQTDVTSVYFADKILITISQGGRLSQWVSLF